MSTATLPPLTKPRIALLILEGAAAVVAAVLAVWLLQWFGGIRPAAVHGLSIPGGWVDVPHQEPDLRALHGGRRPPGGDLAELVGKGEHPPVIFLTAPTGTVRGVGAGLGGDAPADRIAAIAADAKRDLLLVVDLAQVDSDRDIALFGNAPYFGLESKLKETTPKGERANVFVLTSCAPGQKSWMADEAGRSVFAYYVEKGLAGGAKDWDKARPGVITVEGLARYVRQQVLHWVETHRGGAVQGPQLLRVGQSASFVLPALAVPAAEVPANAPAPDPKAKEAETADKGKGKAEERDKEKEKPQPPAPDSPEGLRQRLDEEWTRHEALRTNAAHPPYRYAPAHWRLYQAHLLRAERRVRSAWFDPYSRSAAVDALKDAEDAHGELTTALEEARKSDADFPFHPALGDPRAVKVLHDALTDLTGRSHPELEALLPPPEPKKPAETPGQAPAVANVEETPRPVELTEAALAGRPQRWLELQVPAWALRFNDAFGVKQFTEQRGQLLREIVYQRLKGEEALAHDRRGLAWIRRAIRDVDQQRRDVQDALFGPGLDTEQARGDLEQDTTDFGRRYATVLETITSYSEARTLLDRIEAELPYYGEWLVLEEARASAAPGQSLPKDLTTVLNAAARLAAAIEPGPSAAPREETAQARDAWAAARNDAAEAFRRIEVRYQGAVRARAAGSAGSDWRSLDDLLRPPLIALSDRKRLLNDALPREGGAQALDASAALDDSSPDPSDDAPDRGVLRKAVGLAQLELALLELRQIDPRDPDKATAELRASITAALGRAGAAGDNAQAPLRALAEVTADVHRLRSYLREAHAEARKQVAGRELPALGKVLRDRDRAVRLWTAWELHDADEQGDLAAKDLDHYARTDARIIHAERLRDDYVEDFRDVTGPLAKAFTDVATPSIVPAGGELRLKLSKAEMAIDDRGNDSVDVTVEADAAGRRGEAGRVPAGRAFLGAVITPPPPRPRAAAAKGAEPPPDEGSVLGIVVGDSSPTNRPPGDLVAVGGDAPARPLTLALHQFKSAEDGRNQETLEPKLFYRGRLNGDNAQAVVKVHVKTLVFGDPVKVRIAQDREVLDRAFDGLNLGREIRDVFEANGNHGYMHEGDTLDYVISVANASPEPLMIRVIRTYQKQGSPPTVTGKDEAPRRLVPGGPPVLVRGKVTPAMAPTGQVHDLTIDVVDEKGAKLLTEPLKVTFEQLKRDDYLSFNPLVANREGRGRCFIVQVTRKEDQVTVPIPYRGMNFSVNGEAANPGQKFTLTGVLWHNQTIELIKPLGDAPAKDLTWLIGIGKAPSKSGEYPPK